MKILFTRFLPFFILSIFLLDAFLFNAENEQTHISSNSDYKETLKRKTKKARDEYFYNILKDPVTQKIPENIREKELQFARNLDKANSNRPNKGEVATLNWVEAGPNDVGGRTRALAVDITNSNVVLAGGVNGGIWKSTNKGNSWSLKSDPSSDLSVSYICQDPNNTNIWYYSAGELDQSAIDLGYTASIFGSGIYKSTNSGESWNQIIIEGTSQVFDSPTDFISKIMVSKTSGSIFFAGAMFGIYRSTDGGASFTKVFGAEPAGSIRYYEFDIAANGHILVSTSYKENVNSTIDGGVYYSSNDGLNWAQVTPATYNSFTSWKRSIPAFAPSTSTVAYVWTDAFDGNGNSYNAFYRYTFSAGTYSWVDRSAALPDFGGDVGDINTQGSYNMVLKVKPDDFDFVLLGATNLYRSFDGFLNPADNKSENWIGGYATSNDISQYNNHHPDQHALFFDPANPNALWSGHDGGLSYIENINEISSSINWVDKNNSYNVTQFYKIAMGKLAGQFYLGGGAQDNGSPVFTYNNGVTGTSVDMSSGDGAFIYIGSSFITASSQEGVVVKSYPGGNWAVVSPATVNTRQFIHPYLLDPADENVMYYADETHLYRNTQIGSITNQNPDGTDEGWFDIGNLAQSFNVNTISAFGAGTDHTIYAGLSGIGIPEIVKIKNANTATGNFINTAITSATPGSYVHDIAVNPENSDEVLVIISNYNVQSIYYSLNGAFYGGVETNLGGANGPSVRAAEIVVHNGVKKYYVATSTGVYSTSQIIGLSTVWEKEGASNIGYAVSNDIVSVPGTGDIAVGTHGRGIFVANAANVLSVKNDEIPSEFKLLANYPNPFNPETTIRYEVPVVAGNSGAKINLTVYDLLGNKVATLVNEYQSAGSYNVRFSGDGLASGVYLYALTSDNFSASGKMVLMK